jgi:hypothetical protein
MPRILLTALLLAFAAAGFAQDKDPAKPGPGQEPDPEIFKGIMECLAEGLTPEWFKTWFVIRETRRNETGTARQFTADFFVANSPGDEKGGPLKPCGPGKILEGVGALNGYLPVEQQRWTTATFTFFRDGRYSANYDYTPFKPAAEAPAKPAAKPAAKPPAKKKQEAAK